MMRKICIPLIILSFLLVPYSLMAWDNVSSHPGLTIKAVEFLISKDARYSFLADYIYFNKATDQELTFLDEGSVKEDYGLSADWDTNIWGSNQDTNVPSLSWKSHGYNPLSSETWYGIPDFANAMGYSQTIWNIFLTVQNPYFQGGRFCHMLEDMTAPSHIHADFHGMGDDIETFAAINFSKVTMVPPAALRFPSTDGLLATTGLPHPTIRTDSASDFMRNLAWRTYYMTSYYGATLVESEGDKQPDSELKRMFPYHNGTGLRYDDGGWFGNDFYGIDGIGKNWIGVGIGVNPDWWETPDDPNYFYFESIDGDPESSDPSKTGIGVVPAVFKVNKVRRVLPSDNLSQVLEANTKNFHYIYCENLYSLAVEWVGGFLKYVLKDYVAPLYTVNFVAAANGTISGTLTQNIIEGSSCTAVQAIPGSGYTFSGWSGAYTGTNNPLTLTNVRTHMQIVANFTQIYTPPPVTNQVVVPLPESIADLTPTYTWNDISGATAYFLSIKDYDGVKLGKWYTPVQAACNGSTCSATPNVEVRGTCTWSITVKMADGTKQIEKSTFVQTQDGPPPATELISPTANSSPTFTWKDVPESAYYFLEVRNSTKALLGEWFTKALANCNGTTCSVTPVLNLQAGTYRWSVQTQSNTGVLGPRVTPKKYFTVP
ncbi:MAG: hypothetical protein HQK77_17300 [Desulfobacterales bacterium]|nr:hypothetical protein [Desulfobacterales bacterium]